jgi:hypothetical protein
MTLLTPIYVPFHIPDLMMLLKKIKKLGNSTQLGKKNISSAFHLLPLYPGDFCLAGFYLIMKILH